MESMYKNINKINANISRFAGIAKLGINCNISALASTCDSIGPKVIPLYNNKQYETIAVDLVAANLNDLVCSGSTAVGFMDYIAAKKIDTESVTNIISAISKELNKYNCPLLGGETSEIDGLISSSNIDICGFIIGANPIKKSEIVSGDIVIGLSSNGLHTTGFSIIQKLFSDGRITKEEADECLKPSYTYYNEILPMMQEGIIKDCANISKGGIMYNLSRILPENLRASLNYHHIPKQNIFLKLQELCPDKFYNEFNAGIGFCMVTDKAYPEIFERCKQYDPIVLGIIE